MSATAAFLIGAAVAGVPLGYALYLALGRIDALAVKAGLFDRTAKHANAMFDRAWKAQAELARWQQDHVDFVRMVEHLDEEDRRPQVH